MSEWSRLAAFALGFAVAAIITLMVLMALA